MYCRIVFVLLSLFVAVAISQPNTQACIDAQSAVRANQPCFNAFSGLMNAVNQSTSISSGADLNVYCAAGCRNLVDRVNIACDDDGRYLFGNSMRFNQFVCVIFANGRQSCASLISLPQFQMIFHSEAYRDCRFKMPTGQVCPSACQTAIQNFATIGGCCVPHYFEYSLLTSDVNFNTVIAQCDVDYSRRGTCIEIGGGATGLKAFGSFLLFALIIAVTVI